VDGGFAPYEGAKSISELKADLLADLREPESPDHQRTRGECA
jgi:hypothetical protein